MKEDLSKKKVILDKRLVKSTILRLKLISFLISSKKPSSSVKLQRCIEEIEGELENLI